MPHLEQTVWSDTPLVLLPPFPYAVALDFSGLGSLLISKAQLTQLWPCFFINFTSDRGYFKGIASQRIPTLCPCCESLTLPGCVWSSVAPACTLVLRLLLSPQWEHILPQPEQRNPRSQNLCSRLKYRNQLSSRSHHHRVLQARQIL